MVLVVTGIRNDLTPLDRTNQAMHTKCNSGYQLSQPGGSHFVSWKWGRAGLITTFQDKYAK
jgi:hypothetical protein